MKKNVCIILATVLTVVSCAGITSFADEIYSSGDCNGDGIIDAKDATDILVYYTANSI